MVVADPVLPRDVPPGNGVRRRELRVQRLDGRRTHAGVAGVQGAPQGRMNGGDGYERVGAVVAGEGARS